MHVFSCLLNYTDVQKKGTCAKKIDTPQKSNSHNIKLYDFYLNMIYFILIYLL